VLASGASIASAKLFVAKQLSLIRGPDALIFGEKTPLKII